MKNAQTGDYRQQYSVEEPFPDRTVRDNRGQYFDRRQNRSQQLVVYEIPISGRRWKSATRLFITASYRSPAKFWTSWTISDIGNRSQEFSGFIFYVYPLRRGVRLLALQLPLFILLRPFAPSRRTL
jgi:hypothetical protein